METDLMQCRDLMENLVQEMPQIVLAYLFGSTAAGNRGPLSDYDFAVYLDETDPQKRFETKLRLMGELSSALKSDKIDVVVINDADNPLLNFLIIKDGKIIYEKKPFKILTETAIMSEYFDLRASFLRYNLIK